MPWLKPMRKHCLILGSMQKVDSEIYVMTIGILHSNTRIDIISPILCMIFYRFVYLLMIPVN